MMGNRWISSVLKRGGLAVAGSGTIGHTGYTGRLGRTTLVCTLVLGLAWAASAGTWVAFEISPSTDDQRAPDVDGRLIVWQEYIQGNQGRDWDIWAADLTDPESPRTFAVSNYEGTNEKNPSVFDTIVVWQDDYWSTPETTDWDVYFRDTTDMTKAEVDLTPVPGDQVNPRIYGNRVVWQDNSFGDWDVAMADITDPNHLPIWPLTPYENDQTLPAVWRNRVVWQDNDVWEQSPDGAWNVFGADTLRIDKPVEYLFSAQPDDQTNVVTAGTYVVWQQKVGEDWDVFAAEISNPDRPRIIPIATDTSNAMYPDIDGHLVVWQDDRNSDWDIYGYNLVTRQEFIISDNQPGQTEFTDQLRPRISGNLVVWEDVPLTPDAPADIFAVFLEGPEIATCPDAPPGDANGDCVVNMADFLLMAQGWLTCNLDPPGACP